MTRHETSEGPSRAAIGAAGVTVLALAALASGGGSARMQVSGAAAQAAAEALLFVAAVLGGAAVVLTAIALPRPQRRPRDQRFVPPVRGRGAALVVAAAIVAGGAVALVALYWQGQRATRRGTLPHLSEPASPVTHAPVRGGGPPAWLWLAGGLAGASAVVLLFAAPWERRRGALARAPGSAPAPPGEEEPEGGWPEDPRAAVLVAYARGERRLARAGLARRSAEGPREFRDRLRSEPAVDASAASGLTDLYEQARFSPHRIDGAMGAQARAAVNRLMDGGERAR